MQSQPAHIEVVFEKLTVQSILKPVADKYTMPMAPMRGMSSGTAKQALADRFATSGKDQLILLIAGDLDPSGETISNDFLHYLVRDCDMDEEQLTAWKFAITRGQVREFNLPPFFKAKPSDPTRRAFIERHGDDIVYELDALTPRQLADLFEEAINAVIDVDVYESELAQEERDLKAIAQLKKRILK